MRQCTASGIKKGMRRGERFRGCVGGRKGNGTCALPCKVHFLPASLRGLRTATRLLVWSKKEEGRGLPGKGGMEGGRDTSILQARHVVQTRSVTEVVEEHYT